MKLIIQIPCYNEEQTLPVALSALPREIPGFTSVEWLVVNDGSTDRTVDVAREHGVDHIVDLRSNQGLAIGFMAGIEQCLKLGADVIVNTDADNQYDANCIPALVEPILRSESDIVIGERPISQTPHFSPIKKLLQKLGSYAVRIASNTTVPDAPSGFRAMHRDAAMKLYVYSEYTYTLETIIQAGRKNMRISSVPVNTNADLRPSRLVKSISSYVRRSMLTIMRIFLIYKPMRAFATLGLLFGFAALALGGRFLVFFLQGNGSGHVQSLILASILAFSSLTSIAVAVLADLMSVNRTLLEDVRTRLLRSEINRETDHPPRMSTRTKTSSRAVAE